MATEDSFPPPGLVTLTSVVVFPSVTLSIMYFAYGFYLLLFIFYITLLGERRKKRRDADENKTLRVYHRIAILQFITGTLTVILSTFAYVRQTVAFYEFTEKKDAEKLSRFLRVDTYNAVVNPFLCIFFFVIANVMADIILIHRCYVIWNFRRIIPIVLGFLAFFANVLSLVSIIIAIVYRNDTHVIQKIAGFHLASDGAAAGTNSLITVLTAARLWWLTRKSAVVTSSTFRRQSRRIVSIILESGVMYPLLLSINVGFFANQPKVLTVVDLSPAAALLAAIAPALVIIRAHYNNRFFSDQESKSVAHISDIRFGNGPESQVNSAVRTDDVQSISPVDDKDKN